MTNHTPTFDTCQKLKEAGFPQDTYFWWLSQFGKTDLKSEFQLKVEHSINTYSPIQRVYAAPILTEILKWLPTTDSLYSSYVEGEGFRMGYGGNPVEPRSSLVEAAALLWLELNGGK